jgi:hypothetical protein
VPIWFSDSPIAITAFSVRAADALAPVAAELVRTAAAATENAAAVVAGDAADIISGRLAYHFASVNAAATFGDALGHFINECASLAPAWVPAAATPARRHAWGVTFAVFIADVALAAYMIRRGRRRRERSHPPIDPFALPL